MAICAVNERQTHHARTVYVRGVGATLDSVGERDFVGGGAEGEREREP